MSLPQEPRQSPRGKVSSLSALPDTVLDELCWLWDAVRARRISQIKLHILFNQQLSAKGLDPISKSSFNRWAIAVSRGVMPRPTAKLFAPEGSDLERKLSELRLAAVFGNDMDAVRELDALSTKDQVLTLGRDTLEDVIQRICGSDDDKRLSLAVVMAATYDLKLLNRSSN